jgi:hypothetical protein
MWRVLSCTRLHHASTSDMQAGVDRCCARSMCAVFIGARMVLTYGWMATAARGERVAVEWDDMALSIALSPHHYLLFTKPAVIHLHNTRLPSGGGALPVMRRYWWDGFCWSSNAQQAPFTVDSTHTYTRALLPSRLHLTALAIHAACQWMPTHA